MLGHARRRAIAKGVPFNLTADDFDIPTNCPVTGLELAVAAGSKCGRDNSPTLDRKIPDLGYVRGNVWVISKIANLHKGEEPMESVQELRDRLYGSL